MNIKQQKLEEFEKLFDHYNPIHESELGEGKLPVWTGSDYQLFKSHLLSSMNAMEEDAYKRGQKSRQEEIDFLTDIP